MNHQESLLKIIEDIEDIQNSNILENVERLRSQLQQNQELQIDDSKPNIFNFDLTSFTDEEKKNYLLFLHAFQKALLDFLASGLNYCSYAIPEIDDDFEKFKEIANRYFNNFKVSQLLTYEELLIRNRNIIGSKMKDAYFERYTKEELLKKILARNEQLRTCITGNGKIAKYKAFYREEAAREQAFFFLKTKSGASSPDLKLYELSDFIQFTEASFSAFKNLNDADYNRLIDSLFTGNPESDKNITERLATFLPIELFDIITEGETERIQSINRERFKDFLKVNGPRHVNFQQFVLSFREILLNDFTYGKTFLFNNYSLNIDIKNTCPSDWNVKNNLFMIFLYSYSKLRVFPILFILPSGNESSYNSEGDSYSFVTSAGYTPRQLFNSNRQFLGVHFIRYGINNNGFVKPQGVLAIFTFKNNEHGNETSTYFIYSIYDSKEEYLFNTDLHISRVEKDEIISRMNVTHQELYHACKYFGLNPYIKNNDKGVLFLTRRTPSDPDLQRLIHLLNMKKVDIKFMGNPNLTLKSFQIIDTQAEQSQPQNHSPPYRHPFSGRTSDTFNPYYYAQTKHHHLPLDFPLNSSPLLISAGGYKKTQKITKKKSTKQRVKRLLSVKVIKPKKTQLKVKPKKIKTSKKTIKQSKRKN
jgi:hypothetical protein